VTLQRAEIQRRILGILSSSGNVTGGELAKRLRLRPHVVRYQLTQMIEARAIREIVIVNPRALGYQCFNILFNLPRASVKKTLAFLQVQPEVSWLAMNVGPRQFEVSIIARRLTDLDSFFRRMGDQIDTHLREPIFAIEEAFCYWGMRFLSDDPHSKPIADFTTVENHHEEDELDRRILSLLTRGRFAPQKIGRLVGVPQSTVQYRIEKLKGCGAVSDQFYIVEPSQSFVQAQLVLNLKSRSSREYARVRAACQASPYAQVLISGLGNWEHKIILCADSVQMLLNAQESLVGSLGRNVAKSSLYIRDKVLYAGVGIPVRFSMQQQHALRDVEADSVWHSFQALRG
jgi:DNA-binding Lrp family transcriptional regulator